MLLMNFSLSFLERTNAHTQTHTIKLTLFCCCVINMQRERERGREGGSRGLKTRTFSLLQEWVKVNNQQPIIT